MQDKLDRAMKEYGISEAYRDIASQALQCYMSDGFLQQRMAEATPHVIEMIQFQKLRSLNFNRSRCV